MCVIFMKRNRKYNRNERKELTISVGGNNVDQIGVVARLPLYTFYVILTLSHINVLCVQKIKLNFARMR